MKLSTRCTETTYGRYTGKLDDYGISPPSLKRHDAERFSRSRCGFTAYALILARYDQAGIHSRIQPWYIGF